MIDKSTKRKILLDDKYYVEDDFTYFCMYDDLMGMISSQYIELPAIADSCYVDRSEVFLPIKDG